MKAKAVTKKAAEKKPKVVKPKIPSSVAIRGLKERVCGLSDPFCEHARGAKYMDESSTKTLSYTIEENFVMGTNASGLDGMLFCPSVVYSSLVTPNSLTGTQLNFTTNRAAVVPLLTGVSKFRIVSAGYKIKCIAPALTASGVVYLRTFAVEDSSAMSTIPGATYACSSYMDIPLVDCKDVTVIIPHTSQVPQHFYVPSLISPSPTVTAWSAPGFCPTTICVSGGPASTPVLHITYVMHVEYTFADGEALALAATPPPKMNDMVLRVAGQVTSDPTTTYETSSSKLAKRIEDKALAALEKFGEMALTSAVGLLM